ncbi:20371_t:CDS:2, partial [Cetraspora pellucida]
LHVLVVLYQFLADRSGVSLYFRFFPVEFPSEFINSLFLYLAVRKVFPTSFPRPGEVVRLDRAVTKILDIISWTSSTCRLV